MLTIEQIQKTNQNKVKTTRKPPSTYDHILEEPVTGFWTSIRFQIAKYIVDNRTSAKEISLLMEKNVNATLNMGNFSKFIRGKSATLSMDLVRNMIKAGVEIDLNLAADFDKK